MDGSRTMSIGERVYYLVVSVVLAVVTGIMAQASFYLGPVPYTMQNVGIILSGLLLPPKYALFSQSLYILLIAVGLPVAAGFRGGLYVLIGPTGGYIAGFPIASLLMSVLSRLYLRMRGIRLGDIGFRDAVSLVLLSAVAVLPVYILGFAVFTWYALSNANLFNWASKIASIVGVSGSKILVLFIATVAVFVPQDILMDHVIAVIVAKALARYFEGRGIVFG